MFKDFNVLSKLKNVFNRFKYGGDVKAVSKNSVDNMGKIKAPWLKKIVESHVPYVVLVVFFSVFVVYTILNGSRSLNNIVSETVEESPYLSISAAKTTGMSWAENFVSDVNNFGGETLFSSWTVSESFQPTTLVSVTTCSTQDTLLSESLMSSYSATGNSVADNNKTTSVNIQIFGAGQAMVNFENEVGKLDNCFSNKNIVEMSNGGNAVTYDNVVIVSMGDVIVSVTAPDNETRDSVFEIMSSRMRETLSESGCVSLNETASDSGRSPYYSDVDYTGFVHTVTLSTNVDYSNIPTVKNTETQSLTSTELSSVSVPESPLPDGMSSSLPAALTKPSSVGVSKSDTVQTTTVVEYTTADVIGPGCSWSWSAQSAPVVDEQTLEEQKQRNIQTAQTALDERVSEYVVSQTLWTVNNLDYLVSVDKWNSYVNEVKEIQLSWKDLNTVRANFKETWVSYVESYNKWLHFDELKAQAQAEYDTQIAECEAKNQELAQWILENQSNSSSSSNSNSNSSNNSSSNSSSGNSSSNNSNSSSSKTKPEGCSVSSITRPSILNEVRSTTPPTITIPYGVTIPDSWPKPDSDSTSKTSNTTSDNMGSNS